MKRIAIGDLHGNDCWKSIDFSKYDEIYFVGDYFDSNKREITFKRQLDNFRELAIETRKNNNIHLCIGNHDYHYLNNVPMWERYSGFQNSHYVAINAALEDNADLLKFIYITTDNIVISHAGISKTFLRNNNTSIDKLNDSPREMFQFCGIENHGNDITQSCIWIRPNSLLSDKIEGYKQIVGHTSVEKVVTVDEITFCDCLNNKIEFFEF